MLEDLIIEMKGYHSPLIILKFNNTIGLDEKELAVLNYFDGFIEIDFDLTKNDIKFTNNNFDTNFWDLKNNVYYYGVTIYEKLKYEHNFHTEEQVNLFIEKTLFKFHNIKVSAKLYRIKRRK